MENKTDYTVAIHNFFYDLVADAVRQVMDEKKKEVEDLNPYYTRNETAERLGVSLPTLYRMTKMNPHLLEIVSVGKKKLYSKTSVEAVLAKRQDIKTC